jgi:hypothetical protein
MSFFQSTDPTHSTPVYDPTLLVATPGPATPSMIAGTVAGSAAGGSMMGAVPMAINGMGAFTPAIPMQTFIEPQRSTLW